MSALPNQPLLPSPVTNSQAALAGAAPMDDRIRRLIDMAGIDVLVRSTAIGATRWRTVRYDKRTRISTQEVAALISLYPQHALWLVLGDEWAECPQTVPSQNAP